MLKTCVFAALALAALADSALADPPAKTPAATIRFAKGATSSGWLPFEYFGGTRIFIPAQVNGRKTVVMLDSGASATVLDKRFARALGLEPQAEKVGHGAGGDAPYELVQGLTLKLADFTLTDGGGAAIDLIAVERQIGHPLPVILGGEVFRDTVVDIDFQGRRIAFRDPAAYRAPPAARAVPLTTVSENRAIVAEVEGRPATLVFDLGNGSALNLYPRFWEKAGFANGRRLSTTMTGGWGGMGVEKVTMVGALAIGGAAFHDLPATMEGARSEDGRAGLVDGNIGMPVLNRFHLIVDFPHNRVLFDVPVDTATAFAVNHTGLMLQPGPEGSKVLYVAPGSPAQAAGLAVGDVIVAVDGVAEAGDGGKRWTAGPVGTTLQLRLAGGAVKALTRGRYF